MTARHDAEATTGTPTTTGGPVLMLVLATLGFAVNFWAWALISPLGADVPQDGGAGRAVRVRRGAPGGGPRARRVAGPDRRRRAHRPVRRPGDVPARLRRPRSCRCSSSGSWRIDSYTLLLVGGFFLGIGGTAFAVGVPFVNAWFPPERRGLADRHLRRRHGRHRDQRPHHRQALRALGRQAAVRDHRGRPRGRTPWSSWLLLRDAPGRVVPTTSLASRLVANARLPITWQACMLYAVAFGGYVAFSVFLPTYLMTAHGLTPADAANRMAGFVVVAVLCRPLGGGSRTGSVRSRCWPPSFAAGRAVRRRGGRDPAAGRQSAPSPSWPWPRPSAPGAGRSSP